MSLPLPLLTKGDLKAIAEAVHSRMMHDACPECGSIGMSCAANGTEYTYCRVTKGAIKPKDQSWDEWLEGCRGGAEWSP